MIPIAEFILFRVLRCGGGAAPGIGYTPQDVRNAINKKKGKWGNNPGEDSDNIPGQYVTQKGEVDGYWELADLGPGIYTGGGSGGFRHNATEGKVLLITGARGFDNKAAIKAYIYAQAEEWRTHKDQYGIKYIIHGGAKGADTLVEEVCEELGIPTKVYISNTYSSSGIRHHYQRNSQMLWQNIDEIDAVGAFFKGGASPGTSDMLEKAILAGKSGNIHGLSTNQAYNMVTGIGRAGWKRDC